METGHKRIRRGWPASETWTEPRKCWNILVITPESVSFVVLPFSEPVLNIPMNSYCECGVTCGNNIQSQFLGVLLVTISERQSLFGMGAFQMGSAPNYCFTVVFALVCLKMFILLLITKVICLSDRMLLAYFIFMIGSIVSFGRFYFWELMWNLKNIFRPESSLCWSLGRLTEGRLLKTELH